MALGSDFVGAGFSRPLSLSSWVTSSEDGGDGHPGRWALPLGPRQAPLSVAQRQEHISPVFWAPGSPLLEKAHPELNFLAAST